MKVCILAAGKGTRITSFGGKLHKGLLPLGNLAVVSHIIAQFPQDTRFVVALGHLAEQMRDYLLVAHPEAKVEFVTVDRYDGPGAGPGYSLWSCRELLDEPFYLTACDTLITTPPPALTGNFMGVQPIEDPRLWCTLDTAENGQVRKLHYKTPQGSALGFVGFAGIHDHAAFWDGLSGKLGDDGEFQVNDGFTALIPLGIRTEPMGWIDTGTDENYQLALPLFAKNYTFHGKITDVTYRIGSRMVKFFPDVEAARCRFVRGQDNPVFARVLSHLGHFFSYEFADGTMLSERLDGPHCHSALQWLQDFFWQTRPFDSAAFADICHRFYGDKTLERLALYLRKFQPKGEVERLKINGLACRSVRQAVANLPGSFWTGGLPSTFHGDLHDDNVVVAADGRLVLIDWRQDFAGILEAGDRYYDLAKFFHTLDLSVEAMDGGLYWLKQESADRASIGHHATSRQEAARQAFWDFSQTNGYDAQRIALLNGLIFINMAPLYAEPMAQYLYHLGRLRLEQALTGDVSAIGRRMDSEQEHV